MRSCWWTSQFEKNKFISDAIHTQYRKYSGSLTKMLNEIIDFWHKTLRGRHLIFELNRKEKCIKYHRDRDHDRESCGWWCVRYSFKSFMCVFIKYLIFSLFHIFTFLIFFNLSFTLCHNNSSLCFLLLLHFFYHTSQSNWWAFFLFIELHESFW